MKSFFSHIKAYAVVITILTSCNFLQVENIGKSTIESFFSEITALDPAVNGLFNMTYDLVDKYIIAYEEIAGDEISLNPNASEWIKCQDYELVSSDDATLLGYVWRNGYDLINNASEIIKFAPKLRESYPKEAEIADNAMAQAYFVRALAHFYISNIYAQNYTYTSDASHLGVINMNHIPSLSERIVRSSCAEVYSQIIYDLNEALKFFPKSKNYTSQYFASPAACHALLARIYLYMNDWSTAIEHADAALAVRDLVDRNSYKEMFTTRTPSKDESFLRICGQKQGKTLYKLFYYLEPMARPSSRVRNLLEDPSDIRSTLFTWDESHADIVMKFNCVDNDVTDNLYVSPILLRASEMYLIRAEANCALGNLPAAEKDIKTLQARARGVDASSLTLSYTNASELDQIIEEERIRELCFEGHRFADIARRHKNVERTSDNTSKVKTLTYPDYRFALQIPAVEIEANHDMQQNPTSND